MGRDDSIVSIFGKREGNLWIFPSVFDLSTEEADTHMCIFGN